MILFKLNFKKITEFLNQKINEYQFLQFKIIQTFDFEIAMSSLKKIVLVFSNTFSEYK